MTSPSGDQYEFGEDSCTTTTTTTTTSTIIDRRKVRTSVVVHVQAERSTTELSAIPRACHVAVTSGRRGAIATDGGTTVLRVKVCSEEKYPSKDGIDQHTTLVGIFHSSKGITRGEAGAVQLSTLLLEEPPLTAVPTLRALGAPSLFAKVKDVSLGLLSFKKGKRLYVRIASQGIPTVQHLARFQVEAEGLHHSNTC
jgi:hypothetical protein